MSGINAPRTPVAREFTVSSTTNFATVSGVEANRTWRAVLVENYTDGDVQIAFNGVTSVIAFTVKQNTDKFISNGIHDDADAFFGSISVKNSTGTGGTVIIRAWP